MIRITHINLSNLDSMCYAKVVVTYDDDSGVTQEMSAKLNSIHKETHQ